MNISKRSSGTEMAPSSWREKETINCLIYEGEILLKFKHIHDDSALIFIYVWNFFFFLQMNPIKNSNEALSLDLILCIISCLFPSGPQVILWNPRITRNMVCKNHCSSSTNSYYRWGNSRRSYLMSAQCCINRATELKWKC